MPASADRDVISCRGILSETPPILADSKTVIGDAIPVSMGVRRKMVLVIGIRFEHEHE
jgi:hypothetical protein